MQVQEVRVKEVMEINPFMLFYDITEGNSIYIVLIN